MLVMQTGKTYWYLLNRIYIIEQLETSLNIDFDYLEEKANDLGCEEGFTRIHAMLFDNLNKLIPEKPKRVNEDITFWVKLKYCKQYK